MNLENLGLIGGIFYFIGLIFLVIFFIIRRKQLNPKKPLSKKKSINKNFKMFGK